MYNNIIQSPNFYRVGLYIRLSESDEGKSYESESESIINQRNLLMNYVKSSGFTLIDEYVDDGFTGTNFDRPGFKRISPKETEIIILPGCNHGNGMYKQTDLYQSVIKKFISKYV